MAPDSPQNTTNAATAVHTAGGVKSCWAKTRPPKTNRFLTHCRGRSETRTAVSTPVRLTAGSRASRSYPADGGAEGGGDAVGLVVGHLGIAGQREHLARRP